MAQDVEGPIPDEEIDALVDEIQEQRVLIREFLAAELGGSPDDYRWDQHFAGPTPGSSPNEGE